MLTSSFGGPFCGGGGAKCCVPMEDYIPAKFQCVYPKTPGVRLLVGIVFNVKMYQKTNHPRTDLIKNSISNIGGDGIQSKNVKPTNSGLIQNFFPNY